MQSFNTISHDVWLDHQTDIWSLNVSQVKLGKTSYLYIFPCCSGNHASIPEIAPERLKYILQKVCPGWRIWDNMFQKVEGSACSENAPGLLQDLMHIADRAQNQGADNNVRRAVPYSPHVLPGDAHKLVVSQMLVCVHAHPQVLLEVRVGVSADHRASVGIKLEVSSAAAPDLQQAKGAIGICKFGHVSEKLPLHSVHFVVVWKCHIVGEQGKKAFVHATQPYDLHCVQGQTQGWTKQSA